MSTTNIDSSHMLFVQSILQLNGSMIIKWDDIAKTQNKYLIEKQVPVGSDRRGWVYYMHLAGEYHATDVSMTITSIDTLETIVFNKATLATHKTTAEEYKYGSAYYTELVNRYPTQEDLIKGILNPVSIDKAIDAPDLTILAYDKSLVEPGETNLISELQAWLYRHLASSYNSNYLNSDALYLHTELDNLFGLISVAIYNIRLDNVKTNRAHSFHIWAHLASNGKLDRFKEHLTDEQRLYLYRNIERLQMEAGRKETFDTLVEKFLVARDIPMYAYEMVHDIESLSTTTKAEPRFRKVSLTPTIATVKNNYSISAYELLVKEEAFAKDNTADLLNDSRILTNRAGNTPSGALLTKVLETEVIDTLASEEITMTTVLLNHWLYWGSIGYYNGMVQIENPFSGELMQMTPIDAYNLNFWFWCKANGITLGEEVIPKQVAYDCIKPTTPVMITDALEYKSYGTVREPDVDFVINVQPTIKVVNNLRDFTEQSTRVFNTIRRCKAMTDAQDASKAYMDMCTLTGMFFTDYECNPNRKNETFNDLLARLGYALDDITPSEAHFLMINTTSASVGDVLGDSNILVDMQQAMVGILRQLSSYDLQFVSQTSSSPNKNTPFSMPRYYDSSITFTGGGDDPDNPDGLLGDTSETLNCDVNSYGAELKLQVDGTGEVSIDLNQIFNYELLYIGDCTSWGEFETGETENEGSTTDAYHNHISIIKEEE